MTFLHIFSMLYFKKKKKKHSEISTGLVPGLVNTRPLKPIPILHVFLRELEFYYLIDINKYVYHIKEAYRVIENPIWYNLYILVYVDI